MEVQTNGMSYKKARTEREKIKLMTYIQYIQQCYKEKKQNHNNKKFMCVNYATDIQGQHCASEPSEILSTCNVRVTEQEEEAM